MLELEIIVSVTYGDSPYFHVRLIHALPLRDTVAVAIGSSVLMNAFLAMFEAQERISATCWQDLQFDVRLIHAIPLRNSISVSMSSSLLMEAFVAMLCNYIVVVVGIGLRANSQE
jgi:hypothetical protein